MPSLRYTFLDASNERSTVSFQIGEVTAANFDALLADAPGSARDDLTTTLEAITIGNIAKIGADALDVNVTATPPANVHAQRETALRVWFTGDSDGRTYSVSIPTADRTVLAPSGADEVDLAGTEMAAFIAALEANVLLPFGAGTQTVTVVRARMVGRAN